MVTLFIDTHCEKVTMSLIGLGKIYECVVVSERSHSEVAMPTLVELLKKANTGIKAVEQIVVVNGPGSFTGVRIGVTIAKTIAYSLSLPIKTITSLEMYGVSADEKYDIVIVRDSKGVYSAKYKLGEFYDFKYQKNSAFIEEVERYKVKVLESDKINYDKILAYLDKAEAKNAHLVNPIYVKEIDALK